MSYYDGLVKSQCLYYRYANEMHHCGRESGGTGGKQIHIYTQNHPNPKNVTLERKHLSLQCQKVPNSLYATQCFQSPSIFTSHHFMCYAFYDTAELAPRLFGLLRPGRFLDFAFWSVPSMNFSSSSMLRESRPMEFRGSRPVAA
jgi:hypothetical protein